MEDAYVTFRKAVEEITKNIGENLEGFVLMYAVKKKNLPNPPDKEDEGERIHLGGTGAGSPPLNQEIHFAIAANIVEGLLPQYRGNMYITTEVMKAKILEILVARERARRP